jgi:hypothetical protein
MNAQANMNNPLALVERVQTVLAQPDAPLAKLEEGLLEIQRIVASCETDLEEIGSRRKIEMTAATPAGELDKRLDAIDKREREVVRRIEIAKTVIGALETRIDAAREADAAAKRGANYDEALKFHVTATTHVRQFLDRFGPECRRVLREYAESEMKSAAANQDLPPGALPITSIEAERRGERRSPKTTVREFEAFVDGRRFIAERGHAQAAERKDGKWEVFLPVGSTGAGDYFVCAISNFVEVTTETDTTPWPENLAKCLSVPSFYVSERSGWDGAPPLPPGGMPEDYHWGPWHAGGSPSGPIMPGPQAWTPSGKALGNPDDSAKLAAAATMPVTVSGAAQVEHTVHVDVSLEPGLMAKINQVVNSVGFTVPLIGGGSGRMDSDAGPHRGGIGSM